MANRRFDVAAFHRTLDTTRQVRGMNWVDVAAATGVSPALLSRMKLHGTAPAADGLLSLCHWAGLDARQFDLSGEVANQGEPIARAIQILNEDRQLDVGGRAALGAVLVTTYQQLAAMTEKIKAATK